MSFSLRLRNRHQDLWQRMVNHPFVVEMGEGTLPVEKFRAYFVQDYVFVNDLVSMVAMGIARAPDLETAGWLNRFLAGVLDPESDLFLRAFKELGVPEAEYSSAGASPTTQAFGDFLVRIGFEGSFDDIATVLYVTEATYLDWGTRLIGQGKKPANPIYREWIDIHGPAVLGELVSWLEQRLDATASGGGRQRLEGLFVTALRYEYRFWEAAYHGEGWPDQ